jgi:acyl-coenzyme A thioesterase PaaI-like protein
MTMNDLDGRPTSHSRVTVSRIITAIDLNLYGTVHGGMLMKFADGAAGAAGARHGGGHRERRPARLPPSRRHGPQRAERRLRCLP